MGPIMFVEFKNTVILQALRTPIGRFGGAYKDIHPSSLAGILIKEAIESLGIKHNYVDLLILGNVIRAGIGMNIAKQALIKAGLPPSIESWNIDMVCSSGMLALSLGALHIEHGSAKLVIAGGVESMSSTPLLVPSSVRWGIRFLLAKKLELIDAMYYDGLTDSILGKAMGVIADEYARRLGVSREELDLIAYESHMRAAKARDNKWFKEIMPIDHTIDSVKVKLDHDEGIRDDTSLEKLAKLPYVFTANGPHTAGTSSQLSDGASIFVLAHEAFAKEVGLKPIARLCAYSGIDLEPENFIEGPVHAVRELLQKRGLRIEEVDYFNNNEAFAVSSASFMRHLKVSKEKLNVFGGAIAIGHPIGATGAIITAILISILHIKGGRYGMASLCHGTGGGSAILIEKL